MKKFIIAAVAAVLCAWACDMGEPVYSITNVSSYLTYNEGELFNDYGVRFTVTTDQTDGKWKVDGTRMYSTFDVLNINYDIMLKAYYVAVIDAPVEGAPSEDATFDPVTIYDCSVSGGYLNLIIGYHAVDGTECPHQMKLYYIDKSNSLEFRLTHEGDGENPIEMDESSLKTVSRFCCFPIYDIVPSGESRYITLTIDTLQKDSEGAYTSVPFTSSLYGNAITF